jgi:hypothetical protein
VRVVSNYRRLIQMPINHGMSESKIESWLNDQVKKLGGKSYKFVSPGNPGVPDRIYLFPNGRIYFVELKKVYGKLSGVQKWQRDQFRGMGCDFRVVYGMDQAKDFIKELKDHEVCTACISG